MEACIDKAPLTPEYKLLQLQQHLSGDGLMAVETLGYSAAAYKTAKVRLQRKFGCQRRKMALHLEQLESIKFVLPGSAKDVKKFANLLDILVVNIKDVNHHEELGKGTLYITLSRKLNDSTPAQYQQWVFENGRWESVETLKEFVIQEAKFQTVALEKIRGTDTVNKVIGQK